MPSEDFVIPDCQIEDLHAILGAFSTYAMRLAPEASSGNDRAAEELKRSSAIQRRFIDANTEFLREAILDADPEGFVWLPKVHDDFLDALDLVVINGQVRDRREAVIYEGEDGGEE